MTENIKAKRSSGFKFFWLGLIAVIVVAGGVASNGRLREMLKDNKNEDENIIIPSPGLCTDNAAMVAGIGYRYFYKGFFDDLALDVISRV